MTSRLLALLPLAVLSACASTGSASSSPLAYRPAAGDVTYLVEDSARVEIDAGGQGFGLTAGARATWSMAFAPTAGGTRVTARLTDLDARMTNPMGPAQTADESAVEGPVVFVLDERGDAEVESVPRVAEAATQFVNGAGIAHSFFPGLPGRAVLPGESWTDTVAYASDEGGARSTVRTVLRYTVAGDSLVAGIRYRLVRSEGTAEQETSGAIAGVRFTQRLEGDLGGHFLWDSATGGLHSLELRSDLTGTMDVAAAPFPLAVTLRGTTRAGRGTL